MKKYKNNDEDNEDVKLFRCKICGKILKKIDINNDKSGYYVKHFKKHNIINKSEFAKYLEPANHYCKICGKALDNAKKKYCSNKCKFLDKDYNNKRCTKKKINDKNKIIVCNICGWSSVDINNMSGILKKHTNKTGHNDWIIKSKSTIEEKPAIYCPYCNKWKTVDINNKSGAFKKHINNRHNKTLEDCFNEFPEYKKMLTSNRQKTIENILKNNNSHVICQLCGKKMGRITISHLKKCHNINNIDVYKKMFPYAKTCSNKIKEQNKKMMIKLNETGVMKSSYISSPEREIYYYIKNSLNIKNVETSNRKILKGKELDIYLPDFKLAIEFNGFPWHTEYFGKKDKNYHLNKTISCKKLGIRLIHIFADEFNTEDKKLIVFNRLKHILKKNNDNIIYARKCKVQEISAKEKAEFLNKYHSQGDIKSKYKLGAYYNNVLVAVMTFTPVRKALGWKSNNSYFEMTRFAINYNYRIIGIAGKLYKYFIRNNKSSIKKIISYADYRWSLGGLYKSLGFTYVKLTKPNYWYIVNGNREHRYKFRKSALREMFPQIYSEEKTESEITAKAGLDRVWDCGSLLYEVNF